MNDALLVQRRMRESGGAPPAFLRPLRL